MLARAIVVEDISITQKGAGGGHLVGCHKPFFTEKLPCSGGMAGGEKFGFWVCSFVKLGRANEQISGRNQSEKKALVIRFLVLFVILVVLEAFGKPIV